MCPACLANAAVLAAGAGSTGGILAVCLAKIKKIFSLNHLVPIHHLKEK
jgi:hypothetical protein